ncbi:serine/threonine protein kinase [Nonomuraea sp. SMC257]|uniref:non-specific serine/threonine protein kinase n=1 Tax=Nonomuraea montanisoli TaxID=2741721 RepID=A0A7Y6M6Z6_9ACTN|nr:serine/threonine-protein kinase [Nonomuraea montanisoli]NUW36136.1 serine/threonine protein kinase [Nonomuraea montanisoli]
MHQHEPGDVLARRYVLLERIASGGTSVLWRARDSALERLVAVKVLQEERELARREARTTARLEHPDAIEVYDYGETVTARGRVAAYVVMRLLDGVPLAERLSAGPLPWREAAAAAARIARVLEAAHRQGIVHRDVSAENVLLTGSGPKLLDFGIAAPSGDPDDQRGTPPYVSPERLAGAPVHPAVDVYALGVLLFEMCTGAPPYPETTWEELEGARRTRPCPRPAGVPGELAALCARCLDPSPARRPTAGDVALRLAAALRRSAARRRLRHGLAVLALAPVAGTVLWLGPQAAEQAPRVAAGLPSAVAEPQPHETPAGLPAAAPLVSSSPRYSFAARPLPRALDRFHDELDAGAAAGRIRADAALDLRQTMAHVTSRGGVAEVRRKLGDRLREGAVEPGLRGDLDALLAEIAAALG